MIRKLALVALCSLALAACSGGSKTEVADEQALESQATAPETTAATAPSEHHKDMEAMCPMHVEGTTMALENVDGGIAMIFTNPEHAEELQKRATMMEVKHAQLQGEHQDSAVGPFTMMASATETGTRIVATPADPSQLDSFRAELTRRFEAQGEMKCPMMALHGAHSG